MEKYEYLTGATLSVIDILVYCEIHQVLAMYDRTLPPHYTKLNDWYDKIGSIESVKMISSKVEPLLEEFKLKEKH